MREFENFFTLFKENLPQFYVGHVVEKIDDVTYKVLLAKGHEQGADKGFDEYEIEATILLPSIQTNRGVFVELKPGERVLLLYIHTAYFIVGSLKKEEQKDFKRVDEVVLSSGVEEKRSFVIKPNALTELVITEDDKLVVRTKNQKILVNPNEKVVEVKTKDGRTITIDDQNQKIIVNTPEWYMVFDDGNKRFGVNGQNNLMIELDKSSDTAIMRSGLGYGFKVSGSHVEIRGSKVDFYNTPF
jgi:hypothetical protein